MEWCQTKQTDYLKIDHPAWDGPASYALTADDIQFFTKDKKRIHNVSNVSIDDIDHVTIQFKKQKNDRNFEVIPYNKYLENPSFCPVLKR